MKYFLTVDQIQEQKVVLLSDQPELALNFPLELLPAELKEGDVLAINIENTTQHIFDYLNIVKKNVCVG